MNDLIINDTSVVQFETINACAAMTGLSSHTQRAYRRWIARYLGEANGLDRYSINLECLDVKLASSSLEPAMLKAYLGRVKSKNLGKQSIMQAKSAVVWMAQLMADIGRCDYTVPAGLSHIKPPRAETGQRKGTWLTQDELRHLLCTVQRLNKGYPAVIARNTAIMTLLVTCGLRRDEVAGAKWSDISHQGSNVVLYVHGKGEKLRIVKLPEMTAKTIEAWKAYHPKPDGNTPIFTRVYRGGSVTIDQMSDKAIWLFVVRSTRMAGLHGIAPHDLRRSFARGAYEVGVPIELIRQTLGHADIRTTERYINATLELNRAATDIWAEALEAKR